VRTGARLSRSRDGWRPLSDRAELRAGATCRTCSKHPSRRGTAVDPTSEILLDTFAALCLGALVGLERQVAEGESAGEKDFPGVRTFAFTSLLGALAVLLSHELGPWMGIALFAATSSFLVLRYRYDVSKREDPGYTTEIASLCTFSMGALAQSGQLLVATVITIAMLVLLRFKRTMHRVETLLSPRDMEALIRFLVITGIVLPLLPNEPLDMLYGVLRPRDVWRMVVLISGISFAGFVLMRLDLGARGYVVSGLLGGLVSSTAATVAYARAARAAPDSQPYETLAALAASAAPLRMLVTVVFVSPALARVVALPLLVMFGLQLLLSVVRHPPRVLDPTPMLENPLTLRLALPFAAIYAALLVVLAGVREWLGETAVFVPSALAATIGVDAPTLSLARLSADNRLEMGTAAVAIMLVAVASYCAKCAILIGVGRCAPTRRVAASLAGVAAAGAASAYALYALFSR
jgi:uncharacterized membrane protein (DUF4010 family)